MKKIFICFFVFSLCLTFSINSDAQGLSGHIGVVFPKGDFGDNNKNWGGANTGYTIGAKYLWDLNMKGLMLSLGADVMYNGLQDEIRNNLESQDFDNTHKFVNVPVTAGLNYALKINRMISVYCEAGIGPDFLKITNDARYYNLKEDFIRSFKISTRFGYKAGGGLILMDKYYLGVHYYGLGNRDVKYKEPIDGSDGIKNVYVSQLSLTLGINFNAFKGK